MDFDTSSKKLTNDDLENKDDHNQDNLIKNQLKEKPRVTWKVSSSPLHQIKKEDRKKTMTIYIFQTKPAHLAVLENQH